MNISRHTVRQVHITFDSKGKIAIVTIEADINNVGDIRILQSVNKQMSGYHWIKPTDELSEQMIQDVLSAGYQLESFPPFKLY